MLSKNQSETRKNIGWIKNILKMLYKCWLIIDAARFHFCILLMGIYGSQNVHFSFRDTSCICNVNCIHRNAAFIGNSTTRICCWRLISVNCTPPSLNIASRTACTPIILISRRCFLIVTVLTLTFGALSGSLWTFA